ncbi:MAG TPA: hypothetical protein VGE66_03200 [Chitinophagaceae bacterium]
MNQPETTVPGVAAPLHHLRGQLINKGYSYKEVQEDGAVIAIYKASATDPQHTLISLPPLTDN